MQIQNSKLKTQSCGSRYYGGFSLLEVVLGGGISLIVGILLVGILINNSGFLYKQNSLVSEGLSLNDAMHQIETVLRQAVSVEADFTKDTTVYMTDSDTLVLRIPALQNGEILDNVYDFVVIEVDSGKAEILRRYIFPDPLSERPAANTVLTTVLETVQFFYQDKAGNVVSPTAAQAVGVTLNVNPSTGAIGSSRSSTAVTTLRNSTQ